MTKADRNLDMLRNFILHITHSSEDDIDVNEPITFTPNQLYQMATDYIEEDHVDGRGNEENNIPLT
jgi:hypothetical protein